MLRGKDGRYLQGAALHSALAAQCRARYFLQHPEQSAAMASASPEERSLINQVALDMGARSIRRAQFWSQYIKPVIVSVGGMSMMTFITLLIRPQWVAMGATLGLIFNVCVATLCIIDKLEEF